MESQQMATKLTQLEGRVATLEDENKIVKGEVKQILTEIRSAILVRDNPFDNEGARKAPQLNVVSRAPDPVTKVELLMTPEHHDAPPEPAHAAPPPASIHPPTPTASHATISAPVAHDPLASGRQPVVLRPEQLPAAQSAAPESRSEWSLLTIAALAAWSEEAMTRIGSLRLEILLDLCEAAGHISSDARQALSRVTDLDIDEPASAPGQNETASMLRQLEALLTDTSDNKVQRSA